jgi:hypothetical protein
MMDRLAELGGGNDKNLAGVPPALKMSLFFSQDEKHHTMIAHQLENV